MFSGPCVAEIHLRATADEAHQALAGSPAEFEDLGQGWLRLELLERSDATDYLQPLFRDVLAAIEELSADGDEGDDGLVYEAPLRAARALTAALGPTASALVLWGSDEWPGLGGAGEARGGELLTIWSVFPGETIADCYAERRRWARHDDEYPGVGRPDDELYRWNLSLGGGETRLEGSLDRELQSRWSTLEGPG